jgi:hypothetical protein
VPGGVGQHHSPAAVLQGHECPVRIEEGLCCASELVWTLWRRETSLALPEFIRHIHMWANKVYKFMALTTLTVVSNERVVREK